MDSINGPIFSALLARQARTRGYGNLTVVDKVAPDMMHLVDAHWFQFAPMNPLWQGIIGFVIAVLCFVSLCGNGVVIYIFATTKSLRKPSNLFIINLAAADFLMMMSNAPPMVIASYYETWTFGPLMCDLYAFCGSLFGCASIWTMTMIAFDRYNVIVKGLAGRPLTNAGAISRIIFIWLFSLVWTIFPFFGWNRYVPEGNMTACGIDYLTKSWFSRSYILCYSLCCYYMPLVLIVHSYWYILAAVAAHERNMREQAKKMNVASLRAADNSNTSTECRLAKVALTTIALWFMAWTPYGVINYCAIFELTTITPLFTIWGSLFSKANAVYNPIVYGIR